MQIQIKRSAAVRLTGLFIIICISLTGCANLGKKTSSMRNLIKLGQDAKAKEKTLQQETLNFQRVKTQIINNKITEGISRDTALKRFGEPILIFPQTEGERWIYKPSQAGWVGGEKIYLFFNINGDLLSWKCVNLNCRSISQPR